MLTYIDRSHYFKDLKRQLKAAQAGEMNRKTSLMRSLRNIHLGRGRFSGNAHRVPQLIDVAIDPLGRSSSVIARDDATFQSVASLS